MAIRLVQSRLHNLAGARQMEKAARGLDELARALNTTVAQYQAQR